MKKAMVYLLVLLMVVLAWAAGGQAADPFINGGFETGPDPDSYLTLPNGNTQITGWTVGGQSIDYIGSYWIAHQGDRSIDLNGTNPGGNAQGSISQTFDVSPNTTYVVSFWYSGNPDGGPSLKQGRALVGSSFIDYSAPSQFWTVPNLYWIPAEFSFTTGSSQVSATLTFSSLTAGQFGPAIDDVGVAVIPLPASALLLGSGLMGLGLLGWRRRQS